MGKTPLSLRSLTIILVGLYVILDAINASVLTFINDMRVLDQLLAMFAVALVSGGGILLILRNDVARKLVIAWSVAKSLLIFSQMFCAPGQSTCPIMRTFVGMKSVDSLDILMLIGYLATIYFLTRPAVRELFQQKPAS